MHMENILPDPRPERVAAALSLFGRPIVERTIELLIEQLDAADGDPDLEDPGDQEGIDEREPDQFMELFADADAFAFQLARIRRTRCVEHRRTLRGWGNEVHVERRWSLIDGGRR